MTDVRPIRESLSGAPCECGWKNPLPAEALRDDWQTSVCGGSGCDRLFEYRGWRCPTESDREGFVIQSRPLSGEVLEHIRALSPAQTALLIELRRFALGGPRRFMYHVTQRGRLLQSCWALWRRGLIAASEDHSGGAATELSCTGFVTLTPLGVAVRDALQASA